MAIFYKKITKIACNDWRQTSGSDTIKLHRFAQHHDKIRYFLGKKFYCFIKAFS